MPLSPPSSSSKPRRHSFSPSENMAGFAGTAVDEHLILPPGFRFHPTDEELITHYLFPKMINSDLITQVIGEVDLNKVEPWDLPWKAKMGEKEWYFFCRKDRKYPTGLRINRATDAGYWKSTGKDIEIFMSKSRIKIGVKKTLVFYQGRAPGGKKTDWVMHEFRSNPMETHPIITTKTEWVISRVFKKSSGGKKVHISELLKAPDSGGASLSTNDLRATYFSNSVEEMTGELTPSSSIKSEGNYNTSCYYDSVLPQDQSLLRLLVGKDSSFPVFAGETSFSTTANTGISIYDHDQFITNNSGDSSWDYSFLLE